jgi:hypothetical protein
MPRVGSGRDAAAFQLQGGPFLQDLGVERLLSAGTGTSR